MKKIRTSVKKPRAQQKNKVSDFSVTCIKQTARNTQISKPKVRIYNRRFLRRYQSVFFAKNKRPFHAKNRVERAFLTGGAAPSKSELNADSISSSEIVCVPC